MKLENFTKEELEKELKRREDLQSIKPSRPRAIILEADSVFLPLFTLCKKYLDQLEEGEFIDEDTSQWVFETAMETFYGRDIWKYTRDVRNWRAQQ